MIAISRRCTRLCDGLIKGFENVSYYYYYYYYHHHHHHHHLLPFGMDSPGLNQKETKLAEMTGARVLHSRRQNSIKACRQCDGQALGMNETDIPGHRK